MHSKARVPTRLEGTRSEKSRLRDELLQSLRSQAEGRNDPAGTSARTSPELCAALTDRLTNESGTWAAFRAFGFEPDLGPALAALTAIEWAFPRVEGQNLTFYKLMRGTVGHSSSAPAPLSADGFKVNRWGLEEPDPARSVPVPVSELQGLLVPGLAFDLKCMRLGRGRGYYDRALEGLSNQIKKIGIAFDRQILEMDLPVEPFDVAMDEVLTEKRRLVRGGSEGKSGAPPSSPDDSIGSPRNSSSERKRS